MQINGPPISVNCEENRHTGINGRDTTSVRSLGFSYNFDIGTIASAGRASVALLGTGATTAT